jgi:hypothetical protein
MQAAWILVVLLHHPQLFDVLELGIDPLTFEPGSEDIICNQRISLPKQAPMEKNSD